MERMKAFLTDENFKHEINFDNDLLPYKIYQTTIANSYPDTLFHWHPELEISYIYEEVQLNITLIMIILIAKLMILFLSVPMVCILFTLSKIKCKKLRHYFSI